MKKWLFLLALCYGHLVMGKPLQDHLLDPVAIQALAAAFGINSEIDLVEQTQKLWLRKNGQERWEIAELSQEKKELVLAWAKKEGLFEPWRPSAKTYDQAIILGATSPRMQSRLNFLESLWREKIRFSQIVWLTGDRPLDPRVDPLNHRCKTESEAAQKVWEEARLPEEMRNIPVLFITSPMKQGGSLLKRPTTEDTLMQWLQVSKACRVLFISDQPFCGYQFATIKTVLPNDYEFDVAGEGMHPEEDSSIAAITLDSIARWIYQENKVVKE